MFSISFYSKKKKIISNYICKSLFKYSEVSYLFSFLFLTLNMLLFVISYYIEINWDVPYRNVKMQDGRQVLSFLHWQ